MTFQPHRFPRNNVPEIGRRIDELCRHPVRAYIRNAVDGVFCAAVGSGHVAVPAPKHSFNQAHTIEPENGRVLIRRGLNHSLSRRPFVVCVILAITGDVAPDQRRAKAPHDVQGFIVVNDVLQFLDKSGSFHFPRSFPVCGTFCPVRIICPAGRCGPSCGRCSGPCAVVGGRFNNLNQLVRVLRVCGVACRLDCPASGFIVLLPDDGFIPRRPGQQSGMIGDALRPASVCAEKGGDRGTGHAVVTFLCFRAVNLAFPAFPRLDTEKGVRLDGQAGFSPAAFKNRLCDCQGRKNAALLHVGGGKRAHPLDKLLMFLCDCHCPPSLMAEYCSDRRAFRPLLPGSPF